jgi:hypothetical protein
VSTIGQSYVAKVPLSCLVIIGSSVVLQN